MKVMIQRYGIVIKSVDIHGDRARIGNAAESELMIDDPYLASHVADLIRKDGEWRIVDTGTSLEGITRNGARVEDEALVAGIPYQVGGFEFVVESDEVPRQTAERPLGNAAARSSAPLVVGKTVMETDSAPFVPHTIMESDSSPLVPKTMFETPMPQASVSSHAPQPVMLSSQPAASTPQKKKNIRPLIIGLAAGIFLLLIVILLSSGKKTKVVAKPVVATNTAPVVVTPPSAPVSGDDQIRKLQIDGALDHWEQSLKSNDDPSLRERYCRVALDVASVYAAAGDTAKAKSYYTRVARVGPPDSDFVKLANSRLQ